MINLFINKNSFEYDIYSLVKSFYPREEYKTTAPYVAITDKVHSYVIDFDEEMITCRCFKEGICVAQNQTAYVADDRKDTKNQLKKLLYKILEAETGRTLPWGNLTGIRPTKLPMALLEEGKNETEVARYLKDTYSVSDEKIALSIEIAKRELSILSKERYASGYSLYVGIPFCPTTCLYCSFTSYPLFSWKNRIQEYLDALFREIDYTAERMNGMRLDSVYIGGGTPTTLEAYQLQKLIQKLRDSFDFSHVKEFCVEAGRPDSITLDKLRVLKEMGVERISINPQTMNDKTLKVIGRQHTVQQTIEAFALARQVGFDNINMDLILGLPGETIEDVKHTMEELDKLRPESLTVHSLAVKRASRLNLESEQYQDLCRMDNTEDMMACTAEYAKKWGLQPYYLYRQKNMAGNLENVGYAISGKEGLYNILIMEEKQSIIAVGAGASTKLVYASDRIERIENVKDVEHYINRIDEMIERKKKGILL